MAARIPARLTAKEGRRFGFTLGGAFLVLAGLSWWRAHPLATIVLGSVGALLTGCAVVLPTRLGLAERAWMGFAGFLSRFTTPVVMAVTYFAVLTPAGVIRRALGGNSLVHRGTGTSLWIRRTDMSRAPSRMERWY